MRVNPFSRCHRDYPDEEGPKHWSKERYQFLMELKQEALTFARNWGADYILVRSPGWKWTSLLDYLSPQRSCGTGLDSAVWLGQWLSRWRPPQNSGQILNIEFSAGDGIRYLAWISETESGVCTRSIG